MPDSRPTKFNALRSPANTARAGPEIVSTCRPAATVPPSRKCAWMLISGESFWNVATASGRPAITPACRAIRTAWAWVVSGMVAIEVMSPARPRSSSSARCTASAMTSGDKNASGCKSKADVVTMRAPRFAPARARTVTPRSRAPRPASSWCDEPARASRLDNRCGNARRGFRAAPMPTPRPTAPW